jgi:hypothetical protein
MGNRDRRKESKGKPKKEKTPLSKRLIFNFKKI